MVTKADKNEVMTNLLQQLQRAAALGLLPQDGAKISASGEFIIEPSNVEADENTKMRNYRFKEYGTSGKAMHAWPDGAEEPLLLVVFNAKEEANAVAAGWSPNPVHGPGGKLNAIGEAESELVPEKVREFAPPGQTQPFESGGKAAVAVKGKPGRKPASKKVN